MQPSFFTRRDWIGFWITTLIAFSVYLFTLPPDVVLDDSGELLTAAYHLGVPHPPGYPIWTISAFLFEHLIPFGNAAWKVNLMSAFYAALAEGTLCLLASKLAANVLKYKELRDFSLPGISNEELSQMAGIVAGLIFAFTDTMWSQAATAKGVYALNNFFFTVLCLIALRWLHAPKQWRWPCLMALFFGMGLTNHQTLMVNSLSFLLLAFFANRRLCRDTALLAAVASAIFAWQSGLHFLWVVAGGLGLLYFFLLFSEPETWTLQTLSLPCFSLALGAFVLMAFMWYDSARDGLIKWMAYSWAPRICCFAGVFFFFFWAGILFLDLIGNRKVLKETAPFYLTFILFLAGISFYLYMPLSSSTNPPMNWGYTRSLDGFHQHLIRGQYERIHPSNNPREWVDQYGAFFQNMVDNFTMPLALLAILTLLHCLEFSNKEKEYMSFMLLSYFFMGLFLVYLLNPKLDLQSLFINRVFYGLAYGVYSIWIGLGALFLSYWALRNRNRWPILIFGAFMGLLLVLAFQYGLEWRRVPAALCGSAFYFLVLGWIWHLPKPRIPMLMTLYALPILPFVMNWEHSEMRGHLYGWRYGHDMLKDLDRNAVVYGGTDPGRFVPTYMIFVDSFQPAQWRHDPSFDRRDLYIITQNALADRSYMNYIRDHYDIHRPRMDQWYHRLLGRDKDYPKEPLRLPNENEFEEIFDEAAQEAYRQNPKAPGFQFEKDPSGKGMRASVQGAAAVFTINGAVAKWIFEHNKEKHTFYVEESFPIEWMYDYLEPAGLIMKLNKEPVKALDPRVVRRDMLYWEKLTAEFLSEPLPKFPIYPLLTMKNMFGRDDLAQRSFSKLRSSIGGLYLHHGMKKEAEKALLESIDLYPASTEGRSRLNELYLSEKRWDDALANTEEWIRLDYRNPLPYQVREDLLKRKALATKEKEMASLYEYNRKNADFIFQYGVVLSLLGKTDECDRIVDSYLDRDALSYNPLDWDKACRFYVEAERAERLEPLLTRWAVKDPKNAGIWFSLAALQAATGKTREALQNLEKAFILDPVRREKARVDAAFSSLQPLPEFQKLLQPPPPPPSTEPASSVKKSKIKKQP